MERWPQWRTPDSGAAGREEEKRALRFPAESSCKSWSAGCARSKRSYDGLCCDWLALRRTRKLDGATAAASGKQRRMEKNGDGEDLITWLRSKKKPRRSLLHASAKPNMATSAPGSQRKLADGEVSPEDTVHRNYRIATRLFSQITPKFVW